MSKESTAAKKDPSDWFDEIIRPGEDEVVSFQISESYLGAPIKLPIHIWRGERNGPTVLVTAAIHGDELNGTGTIRHIISEQPFDLEAGTLVLVPAVNLIGFQNRSRLLPDGHDLNRHFPGSPDGGTASRIPHCFFEQIVKRSDYCIDLHTTAAGRAAFPSVRADLSNEKVAGIARSVGTEFIIDCKAPKGTLRTSASNIGCATILFEAGEALKLDSDVLEYTLLGIESCLIHLRMVSGKVKKPAYHIETNETQWVRTTKGGFLDFHVAPGDLVKRGEPVATSTDLVGDDPHPIKAPRDGFVLGMTTLPMVAPGDAVCHLSYPSRNELRKIARAHERLSEESLHERMRNDLARGTVMTESTNDVGG